MVDEPGPNRHTRRQIADQDRDGPLGRRATDRELIADELRSFKEDFEGEEVLVPWDNLELDEDDWAIKELFEMAGLDPSNIGHWRLLLGILAEFQMAPESDGRWIRRYSSEAVTRWSPEEEDRLFREAVKIIRARPERRWGYDALGEKLSKGKVFLKSGPKTEEQAYEPSTLATKLKDVVQDIRERLEAGHYNNDEISRAFYEDSQALFKRNKTKKS